MWWIFPILSALTQVGRNTLMKYLGHKLDEYVNVLGRFVFILPFAYAATLLNGIPQVPPIYWLYAAGAGLTVAISTMFLSKAFKHTDISLSVAIWKVNLIFLLLLEVIFLKAKITPGSVLGIFVTISGVYLLNAKKARASFWEPFALLFKDSGMRYALYAALLIAPSMIFFKLTIDLSDPYFSTFTNYVFATLFTLPAARKMSILEHKTIAVHWKSFILMGFFAFLTTVFGSIGYQMSTATYTEAVKQIEVIFALAAGIIFFKEYDRVKDIWFGCCVIIVGICIVILNG